MLRSELLVVLCSCWPASALHLGLGPRLASRTRPPRACAPKYDVAASTDFWAASNLLHDTFGGRTAYYWTTLRAPALNANVFFSPSESVCALATPSDDGAEPLGVVQLLLVELRKEAGSGAGKTVAFVQSVAVPPASRRQGVATRLVGWCEEEAGRRWGAVELWLALRTDNEAAQVCVALVLLARLLEETLNRLITEGSTVRVVQAAYEEIRTRTASAISRIDDFEPYVLETPIELELSLKHYMPVETLSYLPNVEKVNSHTIRYIGEDMLDISKFLRVVTGYRVDMQP